jgi:hypothetical protein
MLLRGYVSKDGNTNAAAELMKREMKIYPLSELGKTPSRPLQFFNISDSAAGRLPVRCSPLKRGAGARGVVRRLLIQPNGTAHAGFADPDCRRHGARAPVRGVRRLLARGHGHHSLRQARPDRGLASGAGRILQQARHAQREEALIASSSKLSDPFRTGQV